MAPKGTEPKGGEHLASKKDSFGSLEATPYPRKRWPQDFTFSFDDISDEKRQYFID